MTDLSEDIKARAANIRLLLMDVDGVLTDGRMYYSDSTSAAAGFSSLDGHGIKMLRRAGVEVGIITGRESEGVTHRADVLGITILYQGIRNKLEPFEIVKQETGLTDDEIAYMGDDLPDLPLLRRAGMAFAPPNACPEVIDEADYVTTRAGGEGAVRDAVEMILKAQGKWEKTIARYYE